MQHPDAFNATAYGFFGNLGDADDALEGALEVRAGPGIAGPSSSLRRPPPPTITDRLRPAPRTPALARPHSLLLARPSLALPSQEGLEAPPEEELPDPDLLLGEEEDLGYASMFAAALGEGGAGIDSLGLSADLGSGLGLGFSPKKPVEQAAEDRLGAGSLFAGFGGLEASAEPTPPPRPKPGSIALGGLLAAGAPGSPFGSAPGTSPFGNAFASQPSPLGQPTPDSGLGGALGQQPPVVASLPGGHMGATPSPGPVRKQGRWRVGRRGCSDAAGLLHAAPWPCALPPRRRPALPAAPHAPCRRCSEQ